MRRLRISLVAAATAAAVTGATFGILHTVSGGKADGPLSTTSLPSDIQARLNLWGVVGAQVTQQPPGLVSVDSVEQTWVSGHGPATFTSVYLAQLSDASSGWSCVCWLLALTPAIPMESTNGDPATWTYYAYDATSGKFVHGWSGDADGCAAAPCGTPPALPPVDTPYPIAPPN